MQNSGPVETTQCTIGCENNPPTRGPLLAHWMEVFFSASRGEGNCLFIETTERADERMEQRIRSLAACYGRVLKFFHDKAGSTLVLYSSTKDGRKALDQLKRNRHVKVDVAGRKLQAIFTDQQTKKSDGSHSKACRDPEVDIACSATIEISRLCDDVSEDSLRETFSRFGAIKAVVLKKSTEDTNTAEVEFEERCNVPKAVAEMDGFFFSLTKISVSMVRLQSRFLWLSGIPSQFSGSILQSGLYRYGKFTSFCRVATCIVLSYESVESAAETIDAVKRKGLAMFRPRIEFVTEEFAMKMQKEAEKLVPEMPDAPSQEDDDQKIEPQAQATKETTNFLKNRKFRLKDASIMNTVSVILLVFCFMQLLHSSTQQGVGPYGHGPQLGLKEWFEGEPTKRKLPKELQARIQDSQGCMRWYTTWLYF
ncbi:hypothetical protein CAPTEDRAFT_226446 [Capitella teleta]|uniref:RRM domain-containing protein n=1 Tax=Capitella teleta TaxID=283909 RepID=R7TT93_CAPTE|nr:hypothetical protein CAPTEDRAFT_226446 [Capitella teleta]|eukprot:ELT94711.1 hypothetical protein CAPTEDRAFT_226446 [Capitella teleta]